MRAIVSRHGSRKSRLLGRVCLGLLLAVALSHAAQLIPSDRTFGEAWQSAGYPGEIPAPAKIVNVRDPAYGAVGDGVTDDTTAIRNAINALNNQPGVVYFPAGNYLVNSYYITLKSGTVLRGERTTNTTITIDYNLNHPINLTATQSGTFQTISSGYTAHSYTLVVPDASGFAAGDYAEIRESNDTSIGLPAQGSGYDYSVGQILRIASVDGNTLTLVNPIRVTYKASLTPQIRKIIPIQNAGIENIRFVRLVGSTTNATRNNKHTIEFNYAANCWVRGVETTNDFGAGIGVEYSTQVSVTGCYIHHPYEVDGGGSGYGVKLQFHPGECKFENNIFRKMRHSMALQAGANGNVFGYNYSREATRTEIPSNFAGDVQVHGSFPFCNLFEGLIVGTMQMDNNSGPNGPLNTYFRCRTEGTWGLYFSDSGSTNQNIVGNEIGGSGQYSYPGTSYAYGNNTPSGVKPSVVASISDYSYYLNSDPSVLPATPAWWNIADTYPTIGLPLARTDTKNIPASARYLAGGYLTVGPPSLARQPTNLVVNAGQTAAFSVQAAGTPQALYQWYQDGVLLDGETGATLTIANAQPVKAGSYDVLISDDYGSVRSAAATLTVNGGIAPPTITQQPQPQTICAGGTAQFSVTATGDGTLAYQWQTNSVNLANGGHFSGATTATLTLNPATSADALSYRCIVSNDGGSVTSSVASLTVNPTSVGGTATPTAATVCSGSGTTISLAGQTGSIVKWQSAPDNSTWSDIASTANPYPTGNLTATTWFRAVVQSGGCATANSSSALVSISPPSAGGTATPTAATVCSGSGTTISLAGQTGSIVKWQSAPDNSTWSDIASTANPYPTGNLTATTWFRAVVQSGGCATANSSSAPVTAIPTVAGGGGDTVLVSSNAVWKYLDNGTDQGTTWRSAGFDDTGWAAGPAPLGYGDSWIVTTNSYGPDPNNKYITTYYRRTFCVADPQQFGALRLTLLRDDGAVVYLNGTELRRDNLPAGTVSYTTLASSSIGTPEESTWYVSTSANALVAGINVIAVEVHQGGASSSDLGFGLELVGTGIGLRKGPYLVYGNTNTQMQVLWQTDATPAQQSYVEWGPTPAYGHTSGPLTETGSGTDEHQFAHAITGLAPGTLCYYRVVADASTYAGSFVAAPVATASNVTFYGFGDTRTYPDRMAAVLGAMLRDVNSSAAQRETVALQVADWVEYGGTESSWQNEFFNRSYTNNLEAMARLAVMGCKGNHDIAGGPTLLPKYWPYNGTNSWYSFDYGPVHISVIDQYVDYTAGTTQYTWLTNDLATTSKKFKIALFHEPAFSAGGGHANNSTAQTVLCPLFVQHGVQVALVGHNHYYAHCFTNGVHHVTSGGGGAPLATPDLGAPALVTAESTFEYVRFDVSNTVMTVTAIRTNDTVIESFDVYQFPEAGFVANPTGGAAPLSVSFTDTSTGAITNRTWSFGDGDTTNISATAVTHSYPTGGTYTVQLIVTGQSGVSTNTQPDSILVLNQAPAITQQPQPQTICAGGTAQFSVTATGDGTLTYQWQTNSVNLANGGHFSGATTATLTINPATSADALSYRCIVSNDGGSVTSSAAALTVNPRPTAVVSGNAAICNGGTAVIQAALTGTGPWNLTWSDGATQNGVATSPATRDVSPKTTTTYTVTALSDAHCSAQAGDLTSSAVVTVNPRPTSVVSGSATICNGGTTIIQAALTGTGPWNLTWSDGATQNGVATSPATRNVSPSATTTYTLTAVSDASCTAMAGERTGNAVVTVNATVTPSVSISASPDTTIVAGTSVTFTATPVNAGASPSYVWKKNGTVVGGSGNSYTDDALADNDRIDCQLNVNDGCASPTTANASPLVMTVDPAGSVRITAIDPNAATYRISFTTSAGQTYRVEYASDLVGSTWTTLQDNIAGTGGIVQLNDPTGGSQARRFYRVHANGVYADPAGFYNTALLGKSDTYVSIPFTRSPVYRGSVQSVADNVVTVAGSPNWTPGQFIYTASVQSNTYYAFFASGQKEGLYLGITNNTANSLSLLLDVVPNLSGIAAGDRLVIVPYWTLGTAFPAGRGVVASPSTTSHGTEILLPNFEGVGINLGVSATYYFWNSNWRQVGAGSAVKDDDVLPPDAYFIVRQNTSNTTTSAPPGLVVMQKVAVPLYTSATTKQDNFVALQRPSVVTLAGSGLFESGAFSASPTPGARTDELFVFDNTTVVTNKAPSATYYYWNGAWRKVGAGTANVGADRVFVPGKGVLLRKNATSGAPIIFWTNPPPY